MAKESTAVLLVLNPRVRVRYESEKGEVRQTTSGGQDRYARGFFSRNT